ALAGQAQLVAAGAVVRGPVRVAHGGARAHGEERPVGGADRERRGRAAGGPERGADGGVHRVHGGSWGRAAREICTTVRIVSERSYTFHHGDGDSDDRTA